VSKREFWSNPPEKVGRDGRPSTVSLQGQSFGWFSCDVGRPLDGSRKSLSASCPWLKSSMLSKVPAFWSKESGPMLGRFQLYSMNLRIEVWSVSVPST
jgi:hypothetical protein